MGELEDILTSQAQRIFAYGVRDRFGDNGLVAVVIVDMGEEVPIIREFVMSCRVMGKNIENAIVEDVENYLLGKGYSKAIGEYVPSNKNMPVRDLYPGLGYQLLGKDNIPEQDKASQYIIDLHHRPGRDYRLTLI